MALTREDLGIVPTAPKQAMTRYDLGLSNIESEVAQNLPLPLPGEIPNIAENTVPTGPRESSKGPTDSIAGILSPLTHPTLDFMQGINKVAAGTIDFATTEPVEAVFRLAGSDIDIPQLGDAFQGQYVEGEAGKFYQKGGEFAGLGAGTNIAIQKQLANIAQQAGRSMVGTDSILVGLGKEVSKTPISKELIAGVGAATGGEIGKQAGPTGEFAGSLLGGGVALLEKGNYNAPVSRAKRRASLILRDYSEDPNAALSNLERRAKRVGLTPAQKTDDPLLMQLERDLAIESHQLDGSLDISFRQAQKSLKDEMTQTLRPDGKVDKAAVSNFLSSKKDDLLSQIDDRIAIANDKVKNIAAIADKDPVVLSRSARAEMNSALNSIKQQEQKLWGAIKDDVFVSTETVKKAALEMVINADKSTRLPKKELEFILGKTISRTPQGWKVGKDDLASGIFLQPSDRASELITLRSNILADIRQQGTGTVMKPKSVRSLQQLQGALVDSLDNPRLESEDVRGAYDAARAFTQKTHDIFDKGLIGRLLSSGRTGDIIPPEGTLQALVGSGGPTQAQAAREITDLALLQESVGSKSVRESGILKTTSQFLANEFREKVTDVTSAQAFLADNRQALKRFPQLREAVDQAVAGINQQGARVASLEARKEAVGKTLVSKLAGQPGSKLIKTVLGSIDPNAVSKQLRNKLKREPEAMATFKDDIADHILERVFIASKGTGVDPAQQLSKDKIVRVVNKEMEPLIKQFYGKKDRRNLKRILEDVGSITISNSKRGKSVPPQRNVIADFVGRMAGVGLTSNAVKALGGTGSIVVQSKAAQTSRQITDAMTDVQVRRLLAKAITNDEVMKVLLKTNLTPQDVKTLQKYTPMATSVMVGDEPNQ